MHVVVFLLIPSQHIQKTNTYWYVYQPTNATSCTKSEHYELRDKNYYILHFYFLSTHAKNEHILVHITTNTFQILYKIGGLWIKRQIFKVLFLTFCPPLLLGDIDLLPYKGKSFPLKEWHSMEIMKQLFIGHSQ